MTQLGSFPAPRPSIAGPTMVTALVAAVLFAMPSMVRGTDVCFPCFWNCAAGILVWFLGALPAFMLASRGPYFTGGHGFAAAFLGVGSGSALGVSLQMLYPGVDEAKLADFVQKLTKESLREIQRQGEQVSEAELGSCLEQLVVGFPVPLALVGSVVAGFVGMLTLSLISRRRPQPPAPVNPYSSPEA
ncbi:MAG: hypothetical protein V3U11_09785 [Planctomycetota bacterium]